MSILDTAYALIFSRRRAIGTLIPDVVMREIHRDQLMVTDHPVEKGAAISDHAFRLPSEVEMQVGASDSSAGYTGYAQAVYTEMLSLQQAREPFTVYTGKRAYSNMLIRSIQVTTDETSENVLMAVVSMREVIIAETQTTSSKIGTSQSQASKTSATSSGGTKQLLPRNQFGHALA